MPSESIAVFRRVATAKLAGHHPGPVIGIAPRQRTRLAVASSARQRVFAAAATLGEASTGPARSSLTQLVLRLGCAVIGLVQRIQATFGTLVCFAQNVETVLRLAQAIGIACVIGLARLSPRVVSVTAFAQRIVADKALPRRALGTKP
ncbi:hypothetical protein [Rhizocola hellebori]|nr:hypothetical protein [Rhizocola hellebori]